MTDPHAARLQIERRAETKFARIYLACSDGSGEYSLHVKVGSHGLHEEETLVWLLDLRRSDCCALNSDGACCWRGLGTKRTADAAAVIEAAFERYRRHLDRVLELAWDYRCALRDIGHEHASGWPEAG